MERIDGGKITDVQGLDETQRGRLAAAIVGALIAGPIWSSEQPSLFHADPHAGNLMLTPDGRIGLLDWSLVGRLGKRERVCMTQILIGALTIDGERITGAMLALGEGEGDADGLRAVVEEALAPIQAGVLPGLDWLTALMDATAMQGARYGADLIVFRKVLQTLQGVVADVCDQAGADAALATAFLARLVTEWPARLIAPPFSRALSTHMSNAELAHLFASSPLIASRALAGLGRQ
jgi:ubiquinone biosynthesis protein